MENRKQNNSDDFVDVSIWSSPFSSPSESARSSNETYEHTKMTCIEKLCSCICFKKTNRLSDPLTNQTHKNK